MPINTQISTRVKPKSFRVASGRPNWTNDPQVSDRDIRLADMRGRLEIEAPKVGTLTITQGAMRHCACPRLSDLLYLLNFYKLVRVRPECCAFGEIKAPRAIILVGDFDELAQLLVSGKFPLSNPNPDGPHIAAAVRGHA